MVGDISVAVEGGLCRVVNRTCDRLENRNESSQDILFQGADMRTGIRPFTTYCDETVNRRGEHRTRSGLVG